MERRPLLHGRLASAGIILFLSGRPLRAQDPPQESSSKPAAAPTPKKPDKKHKPDTATQNASDQPTWDPLRAEKDLDLCQYYMPKDDVDPAIAPCHGAATPKPAHASPFRYLAAAQY